VIKCLISGIYAFFFLIGNFTYPYYGREINSVFGSNVFQHSNWFFFLKNPEPRTNPNKTRMMLEYGLNFEVITVK
jgi:hypothetical protein